MSVSVLNSRSNIDVSTGYIFNGIYEEVVEYSQILLNIRANNTTDNNYTLLIEFSPDRINVVSNETTTVIFDYNKLWYITPLSRFFRITLTALSNIQNLVIQTLYKNEIVYKAINQVSGFIFIDNLPEIQAVSGPLTDAQLRLTDVPVSGPLTDAQLRLTDVPVSGPLTDAQLRLTDVPVSIAIPLDTHITDIDSGITFLTQERPTAETYFTTSAGNLGILISDSPKIIRNMSINTISATIIYVYFYDISTVPTNLDAPTFVFTIKDSNNVVFNPLDHHFLNGLAMRATTTYNGLFSPAPNSVFINMTLSN